MCSFNVFVPFSNPTTYLVLCWTPLSRPPTRTGLQPCASALCQRPPCLWPPAKTAASKFGCWQTSQTWMVSQPSSSLIVSSSPSNIIPQGWVPAKEILGKQTCTIAQLAPLASVRQPSIIWVAHVVIHAEMGLWPKRGWPCINSMRMVSQTSCNVATWLSLLAKTAKYVSIYNTRQFSQMIKSVSNDSLHCMFT